MRKLALLMAVAFVATMLTASLAFAQDNDDMNEETPAEETPVGAEGDLPESGGPAILLPGAALLLGSGILTYAILRRR